MSKILSCCLIALLTSSVALFGIVHAEEDAASKALKAGLVGAGTGAIASGVTGGKAGQGALIGAGTGIIGSILLDAITGTSKKRPRYEEEDYEDYDDYDEYYEEEPAEDGTKKVLKNGIVGAGTGAIAAGTTGGKAGQGALIGAGTGVIGNALLDTITKPAPQRKKSKYRRIKKPRNKVIRKYDDEGNLVYEEIVPIEE